MLLGGATFFAATPAAFGLGTVGEPKFWKKVVNVIFTQHGALVLSKLYRNSIGRYLCFHSWRRRRHVNIGSF